MDGQIIPIELKVKNGIVAAASLKFHNKFACLNGSAEFALASIDNELHIQFKVIRESTPGGDYSGIFGADETGKFMWCKSGWREAIIIDTETKRLIKRLASFSGNSFIGAFYPIVGKDNFIYVWVKEAKGPLTFPVFDFKQDSPVAIIDKIRSCFILQKQSDSSLIVSYEQENKKTWINATLSKKDIIFNPADNLTNELTKNQIDYRSESKAYCFDKNIIIGALEIGDFMRPCSVRWNADKTDIKIEPLLLQRPKPYIFEEKWAVSLDGNWCMNKALINVNTKEEHRIIVFYQVGDLFPQGLSLPVYGGLTSEENLGCFINHDKLGPLYLDITPAGDPVIYKLNQIPGLLAKKLKK